MASASSSNSSQRHVLLHPYQNFGLCVLNRAFCEFFDRNKDGTYNESRKFENLFLEDFPELHEMQSSMVALTTILVFLAAIGVCGQSFVLWIYWKKLQVGPAGTLIIGVAAIDWLVCAIFIPLRLAREWGTKLHSELGCKMIEVLDHQVIMSSLSLLLAIAVERYWCIVRSPGKLFTAKGARFYFAISIVISGIMALPWSIAVTSVFLPPKHRGYCLHTDKTLSYETLHKYAIIHTSVLLLFAFLAVLFYTITFLFILRESQDFMFYAKASGKWIRKQDKPEYDESECSDSSANTQISDAPSLDLEMQVRNMTNEERESGVTQILCQESEEESQLDEKGDTPAAKYKEVDVNEMKLQLKEAMELTASYSESQTAEYTDEMDDAAEVQLRGIGQQNGSSKYKKMTNKKNKRSSGPRKRFHRNPWHRLKSRTAITLFLVSLMFIICHIPSSLMRFRAVKMLPPVYYLYFVPHSLSWIIYMVMNKQFRNEAKFMWR